MFVEINHVLERGFLATICDAFCEGGSALVGNANVLLLALPSVQENLALLSFYTILFQCPGLALTAHSLSFKKSIRMLFPLIVGSYRSSGNISNE
jgi:hypothetical protein